MGLWGLGRSLFFFTLEQTAHNIHPSLTPWHITTSVVSWSASGTAASPVEPWVVMSGSKYSEILGEALDSDDVSDSATRSLDKYATPTASAACPSRRPQRHNMPLTNKTNNSFNNLPYYFLCLVLVGFPPVKLVKLYLSKSVFVIPQLL